MVNTTYAGVAAAAAVVLVMSMRRRRRNRARDDSAPKVTYHGASCGLSVLVEPTALTDGWAVAPPLFYPPYYAVVPIIHNHDTDEVPAGPLVHDMTYQRERDMATECGYFLCDASEVGTISQDATSDAASVEARLRHFCATNPVLSGLAIRADAALTPLDAEFYAKKTARMAASAGPTLAATTTTTTTASTAAASAAPVFAPPFSHSVDTDAGLLFVGVNGLYCHAAVFFPAEADDAASLTEAAQMVLNACASAPLSSTAAREDERRAPSAPGAGQGAFHVYYLHKAKLFHFSSPPSVRVKHLHVGKDAPGCLFHYSARVSLDGGAMDIPVTTADLDRVAASAKLNESVSMADFMAQPDGADANTNAGRLARAVTVTVEEGTRLSEREGLTVLYQQPSLGAFFSVQPGGDVYDPFLSDTPRVWYYPFGTQKDDQPSLSLQSVSPLPSTWEPADKGDDVFVHNVIFHLTEWDKQRTVCTFTEISGIRCAQFQEDKEERRCRTYVVPRKDSLLLIRWEAAVAEWDGLLPTLQFFIDTLHLYA